MFFIENYIALLKNKEDVKKNNVFYFESIVENSFYCIPG